MNVELRFPSLNASTPDAQEIKRYLFQLVQEFNWALNQSTDNAHPVGSIYLSAVPTNPAELFGGTWETKEMADAYAWVRTG